MKINTQNKTIKKLLSAVLTASIIATSFASVVQASAQTTGEGSNQNIKAIAEMQTTASPTNTTKDFALKNREFIISNEEEFSVFMTTPLFWSKAYKVTLERDIDMLNKTFEPIKEFSGVFDGCGHTINNLNIQNKSKKDKKASVAVIRTLNSSAEFKNVTFNNGNISGRSEVAGLVITNNGNISKVNIENFNLTFLIKGNVNSNKPVGFVYNNEKDGTIENCNVEFKNVREKDSILTTLTIQLTYQSGFVYKNDGNIKNCNLKIKDIVKDIVNDPSAFKLVVFEWMFKSGFVYENNGKITNSDMELPVDTVYEVAISGFVTKNFGTIEKCNSKCNSIGKIKDFEKIQIPFIPLYAQSPEKRLYKGVIGGFVSENFGIIKECTSKGEVGSANCAGGFCGNNSGEIRSCTSESAVETKGNKKTICGGFVGNNEKGIIDDCTSKGDATGEDYAGGFAGINKAKITKCTATGKAIAKTKINTALAGGFVGENEKGKISYCTAEGGAESSSTHGQAKAGGFVGVNKARITNSKAYTKGKYKDDKDKKVYLKSGISHEDNGCGGFVGKNDKDGNIDGCYAECKVETSRKTKGGGFVGEAKNNSEIYDSKCKTKRIIKKKKKEDTEDAKFCYKADKKAKIKGCDDNI